MQNHTRPLSLITGLFFLFGFITCLNDILIPHLKGLFTLSYTQAMLVQVCFFSAYFFMSIPSGKITAKFGYPFGIVSGLLLTSLGTLGFIPASAFESYPVFLISLLVLASGITLLQVAVNPYVTLLGPPEKSAFRLNLAQAFNSLGTTLAPIAGSVIILKASDKVSGIQIPYLILTISIVLIALFFSKIKLPSVSDTTQNISLADYFQTLKDFPHLRYGMLCIFVYVGAEVSIGSFLTSWLSQEDTASLPTEIAAHFVAYYWGGAMIGRFVGSYLTAKFRPLRILQIFSLISLILLVITMTAKTPFFTSWPIIGIGLFNSVMFPIIFSLSVDGLKEKTPMGSGLLCTCIVGGGAIPFIQGLLADQYSLRFSFIIPLICYFTILFASKKLTRHK